MTVIDSDGYHYSTPLTGINTDGPPAEPIWDYDGCVMWGGWEEEHVKYLKLHGLAVPPLSKDAKEGKQSAALKPGKHVLTLRMSSQTHSAGHALRVMQFVAN